MQNPVKNPAIASNCYRRAILPMTSYRPSSTITVASWIDRPGPRSCRCCPTGCPASSSAPWRAPSAAELSAGLVGRLRPADPAIVGRSLPMQPAHAHAPGLHCRCSTCRNQRPTFARAPVSSSAFYASRSEYQSARVDGQPIVRPRRSNRSATSSRSRPMILASSLPRPGRRLLRASVTRSRCRARTIFRGFRSCPLSSGDRLKLLNHLAMILNHLLGELFHFRALRLLLSQFAQFNFSLIAGE